MKHSAAAHTAIAITSFHRQREPAVTLLVYTNSVIYTVIGNYLGQKETFTSIFLGIHPTREARLGFGCRHEGRWGSWSVRRPLSGFVSIVRGSDVLQVYTSGKGSSAAGLTASVTRDPGSVSYIALVHALLRVSDTPGNPGNLQSLLEIVWQCS